MSTKRAAYRRSLKAREKAEKKSGMEGELLRLQVKGKEDGRSLAYVCMATCLVDHFGYGRKRIVRVNEAIRTECANADRDGTFFVFEHHVKEVHRRLEKADYLVEPDGFMEHMYICQRDEAFSIAVAGTMIALQDAFNFSQNKSNTGRLDFCLDWMITKYAKYMHDKKAYDRDKKRIEDKLNVII